MRKLLGLWLCVLAVLSGCTFRSGDALLFPPKPMQFYEQLKKPLAGLLGPDTEYAPPTSGYNRQSIQSVDLNGDGVPEALVFLRTKTADQPLRVYIFEQQGDEYVQTGVIAGSGDVIDSVDYTNFSGSGNMDIVIGWRIGSVLKVLTVHSFVGDAPVELMSAHYTQYSILDLNENQTPELVLIKLDEQTMTGRADFFQYTGGEFAVASSAPLSLGVEAVRRVRPGKLIDGCPALLVTSQYQGKSYVTDVLVCRQQTLVNVSLNMETGVSDETIVPLELYATDIDADGTIDVPHFVELPFYDDSVSTDTVMYLVCWRAYDSSGRLSDTLTTYHSVSGGWYLVLPDRWLGQLTAARSDNAGLRTTVFALLREGEAPVDLLYIYVVAQSAGSPVNPGENLLMFDRTDSVILAELPPVAPALLYEQMSESELRSALHLIPAEWLAGV